MFGRKSKINPQSSMGQKKAPKSNPLQKAQQAALQQVQQQRPQGLQMPPRNPQTGGGLAGASPEQLQTLRDRQQPMNPEQKARFESFQSMRGTPMSSLPQAAPSKTFGVGQMPIVDAPNQGRGSSQGVMGKGLAGAAGQSMGKGLAGAGLGAAGSTMGKSLAGLGAARRMFKKGGKVKAKASSASKKADGVAIKGKTKGRFV